MKQSIILTVILLCLSFSSYAQEIDKLPNNSSEVQVPQNRSCVSSMSPKPTKTYKSSQTF